MNHKPFLSQKNLYFKEKDHLMYLAVDCVIFGFDGENLKLLIMKRKVEPLRDQWSLIGGFVHLEENAESAALRILGEATGLDDLYLEQFQTYTQVQRDPGYRCASVGMYALIRSDQFYHVDCKNDFDSHWHDLDELPDLVLDHQAMVEDALFRIKEKARNHPMGFELLPEKFTIPQLQKLYEAIYDKGLDPRNFRKKILSLNVLKQLKEKDKSTSKKGAYLYEFDKKKFNRKKTDFSFWV